MRKVSINSEQGSKDAPESEFGVDGFGLFFEELLGGLGEDVADFILVEPVGDSFLLFFWHRNDSVLFIKYDLNSMRMDWIEYYRLDVY